MLYIMIGILVYDYMNLLKFMEEFIKNNEFYSKKLENGEQNINQKDTLAQFISDYVSKVMNPVTYLYFYVLHFELGKTMSLPIPGHVTICIQVNFR